MTRLYAIDVRHTRRYVLLDTNNSFDPWQATIDAVKSIKLDPDIKYIYGDDRLHSFIDGSLQVIQSKDISDDAVFGTDVLIGNDGNFPFNEPGKRVYPENALYYSILAKHERRYVVELADNVKNPLKAAAKIIERIDRDGYWDISFGFGHNHMIEFLPETFTQVSRDNIDPRDYLIDFKV